MELSNDQSKMDIVARLVKEGAIDFNEAIKLLQVETTYLPNPFIPQPIQRPFPYGQNPYTDISKLIKPEKKNPY